MYLNCQKIIAFKLFDEGKRPAEIFNELPLKKQTIFRYFQIWKKEQEIAKQVTERNRLQRYLRKRIEACEMDIEQIRRYPEHYNTEDLAKLQRAKRRAEQLLKDPSTITDKERELLYKWYST